jgi:putative iron-dependent peroxidase
MNPQAGIFALGTSEHCYIELDLLEGVEPANLVSELALLQGKETPLVGTSCVVGFRPELWADVLPEAAHPGARSFEEVVGEEVTMPATQHDAWIWLAGSHRDATFESALVVIDAVCDKAAVASELTAWAHLLNRDLTGFIDGTENPSRTEAPSIACRREEPAAGSSILLFQKWSHSPAWRDLPVTQQEKVIGRKKSDSEELSEDEMPADSHVSRNVIEEDGEELKIFRRNTAWGGPTEHGTVFVGFCAERKPLQLMLEHMVGKTDGPRDALTYYTEALSGAYYVVPSFEALARLLPELD